MYVSSCAEIEGFLVPFLLFLLYFSLEKVSDIVLYTHLNLL